MNLRKSRIKIVFLLILGLAVLVISFLVCSYNAASRPVSYLPFIETNNLDPVYSGSNRIELKTPWFIFIADESGSVAVETPEGDIIMSSLTYFSSYEGKRDNWGLINVSVKLTNDSTVDIVGQGPMDVLINESFVINNKVSKIDVRIRTRYKSEVFVNREALVAKFEVPVTEVYLKNRKIDSEPFDPEYWLQNQGVRFGSGDRSSLIYNTTHVSSLQLVTEKKLLFINLDYSADHPFVQIPYQKDGLGKWQNLSTANYSAETERENFFSIYFSNIPRTVPRLMSVPYGYTAGYVFTEHADGGNIKTNRAAYFGDENITDIIYAKRGFAGHKIPVTKSVFYSDSAGYISGALIHDKSDKSEFLDFLNQIYKTGQYDICLHTPEDFNSNRVTMNESLSFMKNTFDAVTWIDHGMYSGNNNREAFICDGLNPASEYFAADMWENYNTRYFWNPATEMIENSLISPSKSLKEGKFYKGYVDFWKHYLSSTELIEMSFPNALKELLRRHRNNGDQNSFRPGKGSSYPTPIYWQHPTRTRQFYSWKTDYVYDYGRLLSGKAEKELLNEQEQIDMLLENWGVFINHGYYVRNLKDHNIFNESNGRIEINPFFDKVLEYMSDKRESGYLYLTTIRDLLDYWNRIKNVSFEYLPEGAIYVINRNNESVRGLSLALNARTVRINGKMPYCKQVGGDIIAWFDIPGKSYVTLKVEK